MSFMDMFKPDWKSSNPEIRRKALIKEQNPEILIEALKEEDDDNIVSSVIDGIGSIELLETLKSSGIAVSHIDKKLNFLFMESAIKSETVEDVKFDRLDEKQLGQLARKGKTEEIQLQAVSGLSDKEILSGIVDTCEKKIANIALEKISDKAVLSKLVKSAKHKGSRLLARKRYDELFGEAGSYP